MVDSRSGAGNIKDESGTSYHARSRRAVEDYKDSVERIQEAALIGFYWPNYNGLKHIKCV